MNKKRILQVNIDNDGGNGAFALVRYLYSYLKDDFIFDYFTMGNFVKDEVYENIVQDGGKCFSSNLRLNKLKGHIKLPFVFYKYLKSNYYEIVHIHSEVAYKHFLYAIAAKCAHVKKIIIHSHSNDIDGENKWLKLIFHKILIRCVNKLGTDFLACSLPAAEWMFTTKTCEGNKFHIFHNGIDPVKYKYKENIRDQVRNVLNIQNKTVIGHVGALKKVKNQQRLLELLHDMNDDRYMLMLIGDGEDRRKLVGRTRELGLEKQVLFLGSRTDVFDLLQAVDIFAFPSFFEGIPMALIEAQTVGIPIIASDTINKDIKINENLSFISLADDNNKWISEIKRLETLHIREKGFIAVMNSKFNVKNSAELLKAVYVDA